MFKKLFIKIKNWYNSIYGADETGFFILLIYIILLTIAIFLQNMPLYVAALITFAIFVRRFFSLDCWTRRKENMHFCRFIKLWRLRIKEYRTSRIFICPDCGNFIRVPKNRGKIRITCPVCKTEIIKKT